MTTPLLVDFETRSRADLKQIGGRLYAEHPSTEVICAVLSDGVEYESWIPGDPPALPAEVAVAHNAIDFDRHIWRRLGWPEPGRWIDTAQLARRAGLPGALGKLALLEDPDAEDEKDSAGNALTRSLSGLQCIGDQKRKNGTVKPGVPADLKASLRAYHRACKADLSRWPEVPDDILDRVIRYCQADVEAMAHAWPFLAEWDDLELEVEAAERAVNDRGICFDVDLAMLLLDRDAEACDRAVAAAGAALGVPDLTRVELSPARLKAHLAGLGVIVTDATFGTVEDLTRHHDPRVRAVAEGRLALASIARGKLTAGLARSSPDGRMRDSHKYYGAHTGRWSGKGFQVQNIPWIDRRGEA